MKPRDLAPVKQKLLAYWQDNPVRRVVRPGGVEERGEDARPPLSPAQRDAYQLVVAKTIIADGQVEPEEIARLYYLFAALDTTADTRLSLLRHLAFERGQLNEAQVPPEILENEDLRFALARDALLVSQVQEADAATQRQMHRILGEMQLTPAQAEVMFDWVAFQNSLLRGLAEGVAWASSEDNVNEFVMRAEEAGLPVAALLISGAKRIRGSDIIAVLNKVGSTTGIRFFRDPVTAGIAMLVMAGITVVAAAGYVVSVASDHARERAAAAEAVALQLRAATWLAHDLPGFEASPGLLRGKSRKEMTTVLHDALVMMLEHASAPLEPARA